MRMLKVLKVGVATCLMVIHITACSTLDVPVNNIISIDPGGGPTNPYNDKPLDAKEYSEHITEVLDTKKKQIILYIHGGLKIPSSAKQGAVELLKPMTDAGYHPIFINWRSGLATSYAEHHFLNRQGETKGWMGVVTSPFVLIQDLARGAARTPMVWWYRLTSYFKGVHFGKFPSERHAKSMMNALNGTEWGETPSLHDLRSGWDKIGDVAVGGLASAVGLAVAPLLDAVGTGGWEIMTRRTETMFTRDREKSFSDLDVYEDERKGALIDFMNALEEKQKAMKEKGEDLEIILSAHSLGTLVADSMLIKWPNIKFRRIIYMASASSIKDFRNSVVPHLRENENNKTHFYNYMLDPRAENLEAYVYVAGTGSLLNQIDEIYKGPVAEADRTLGRWVNVMNNIDHFMVDGVENQIHLRAMPFGKGYPAHHWDFNETKFSETSGYFWDCSFGKIGIGDKKSCP